MKTPEQWFNDHYPTPASSLKFASDLECLKHSIAKFKGFKSKNLPEGWTYRDHYLMDKNMVCQLTADSESCALCQKYSGQECENAAGEFCPIKRFTGYTCCDQGSNPYRIYCMSSDNPQPMLELLNLTALVEGDKE